MFQSLVGLAARLRVLHRTECSNTSAGIGFIMSWDRSSGCPIHCFSLVVCREHATSGRWLAVEENKNRGWWLPGGFVECGDDHYSTAIKETWEEAGVKVTLKGILRIENEIHRHGGRQRVIFYAEPEDELQTPKSQPDEESMGAAWMTVAELRSKRNVPPPNGLRGLELLDWAAYIETVEQFTLFQSCRENTPRSMAQISKQGCCCLLASLAA